MQNLPPELTDFLWFSADELEFLVDFIVCHGLTEVRAGNLETGLDKVKICKVG